MKKILFLAGIIILVIYSCTNSKQHPSFFKPTSIRAQHFSIDPSRDTILMGLRGGFFRIASGSFEGKGSVNIEIKEVYNPIEILYAGLNTESDGRLLESGGMVYFNAKRNGHPLELLHPVSISLPANYINKDMQLFKGKELKDGSINWVDPEPIDFKSNPQPIDTGEVLFNTYCASCHQLFKNTTGPALAAVEQRVNDRNVLKAFIWNPAKTIYENEYFNCEHFKFKSIQPAFPNLSGKDIDLILDFIKNETTKRPDYDIQPPSIETLTANERKDTTLSYANCLPAPCGFDTLYVDTTNYPYIVANMIPLHVEATKEDSADSLYKNPDELEKLMRTKGFEDIISTNGRYNFTISTMGWFNVDAFYEGMKGSEIVDLFVHSDFANEDLLDVHVFFPAKKILTVGTFHTEDSLFHFEKYKGQIPLFLNDQAVAFGFTSIGEKLYYGITPFTVGKKQTIEINVKECTTDELDKAFKDMQLDGVDLDIITKKRLVTPRSCADSAK